MDDRTLAALLVSAAPEVDEIAAYDMVVDRVARARRRRIVRVASGVAAAAAIIVGAFALLAALPNDNQTAPPATSVVDDRTEPTVADPTAAPTTTPVTTLGQTAPSSTTPQATTQGPSVERTLLAVPPGWTEPIERFRSDERNRSSIVVEYGPAGPTTPFGSDDGDGSGCTPGSASTLPDGLWYVGVVGVDGSSLLVDLVCRYSDDARQEIYTPESVLFDDSVRNDSTLIRTVPTSSDVRIIALVDAGGVWGEWIGIETAVADPNTFGLGGSWLRVVGGEIVEVYQNFKA